MSEQTETRATDRTERRARRVGGRRPWAAVAILVAGSVVAAACGSDGGSSAAESSTTAAAAAAPKAAEAPTTTADPKANWPKKLVFSVVPAEQNADLSLSYKPLIDKLEKNTGLDVEFFQATDYNGVIEGMISGKVDIAEFGPFSYVLAKNNGADISAIGVMVNSVTTPPGYQAYGIVKGDSPITDIAGFKGKKVCFVDPGSTSGYLYPSAGLIKAGINPEKDITPTFAGGHDTAALAVKDGTCEAGFAFDTMVDKTLVEKGSIKAGELKVVWKSELIPGSPLAVSNKLPKDLFGIVQKTVLEDANKTAFVKAGICADEATCKVISDGKIWGFVKTDDAYYNPIRTVCEATKSARCVKA